MMRSSLLCLLIGVSTLSLSWVAEGAVREWTSSDGKKIDATLIHFEGETVTLETERGRFDLPLTRLSETDQAFVKEWAEAKAKPQEAGEASGLGKFENLELGVWPQYVVSELSVDQIETLPVDSDSKTPYVYRTPHFEFRSPERLSASVVREFSRIFEATFNFVDQMPIGLAPKPNEKGYYITELYKTMEDYLADGGMEGSGGMFSWRRRGDEMDGEIKVPLSNLGVEYTGTRFVVDQKKRSNTLTHEITHQVMMYWLATPMPVWLSEGLAEIVASQNYDNGRYRLSSMDAAIVAKVTGGQSREFEMLDLKTLMEISHAEWAQGLASSQGGANYRSANILAYYFLRLDGEGDGHHLVEFLKSLTEGGRRGDSEIAQAAQEEHLLRGRSYEELEQEIIRAWRSKGLKIKLLGKG